MQRKFENTKITVEFDEAGNRQQLSSGDSLKTLFAKIKRWFSDLNPVAFSGSYNDLSDKPETTEVPKGFDHRDNDLSWGTQEGEYITAWNAGNNCTVGFRKNCPKNGKASMILDGTVYVDEGKYPVVSHDDIYDTINNIVLVGNGNPPITKPWHKVAELELNEYDKCADENITLLISTEFFYNTISGQPYCGILRVTTRVNENVQFEKANIKWILLDKKTDYENEWILLHNNETPCKFELWTKVEDPWMFLTVRLLSSSNRSKLKNKWKLLTSNCNGTENYTEGMTVIRQTYSELIGNISSANKLSTPRNIALTGNLVGSANFDGSGDITITARNEYCIHTVNNTNNYPYHRFAYTEAPVKGDYKDCGDVFMIVKGFGSKTTGGIGIFQVYIRSEWTGHDSYMGIRWLVRDNCLPVDCIQGAINVTHNSTTVDLFYKNNNTYQGCNIFRISDFSRVGWSEKISLKMCNSAEENDTTVTDNKQSYECYKTLDDAETELGRNFSEIIVAESNSIVKESWFANKLCSEYIPKNSDLNTYVESGIYYNNLNAETKTLANCPTQNAFVMFVKQYGELDTGTQEITEYLVSNPKRYMRNFYNSTWGQWYRVYTTADKPTASEIGCIPRYIVSTVTNFDNVKDEGVYCINVSGCTGLPVSNWGTVFVNPYGTKYQIFIVDQTKNIYKRSYKPSDGKWGEWINLFDTASASNIDWSNVQNKPTIPTAIRVKGNAESAYRTGDVNLTSDNIGALNKFGDTMNGNIIMAMNKGITFKNQSNDGIWFNNGSIATSSGTSYTSDMTIKTKYFYVYSDNAFFYNKEGTSKGNIYANLITSSSRRVKENIHNMTADEAIKILDINVVGFDYINGDKNQYGMIAEEVNEIIPNMVSGDVQCNDNDTEAIKHIGIDYSKAVPYLIKMVQMMDGEIKELKEKLKIRDKIDE